MGNRDLHNPFVLSLSKHRSFFSTQGDRAHLEAQLVALAAAAHPLEACGLLLGDENRIDEIRPCANVHPTPQSHFEIDPQALIDAHRAARSGGPEVVGYWHSHPSGPPAPSATDRAHATGDGRAWAIVGEGRVGWWRDAPGGFEPLSYTVQAS